MLTFNYLPENVAFKIKEEAGSCAGDNHNV